MEYCRGPTLQGAVTYERTSAAGPDGRTAEMYEREHRKT
jgi:hypothetical protein